MAIDPKSIQWDAPAAETIVWDDDPDRWQNSVARGVGTLGESAVQTAGVAAEGILSFRDFIGKGLSAFSGREPPAPRENAALEANKLAQAMRENKDELFPAPQATRKLQQDLGAASGFWDSLSSYVRNPAGTAQMGVETLVSSAPAVRALGVVPGSATLAGGGAGVDAGAQFDDEFKQGAIQQTPEYRELLAQFGEDGAREILKAERITAVTGAAGAAGGLLAGLTGALGLNPADEIIAGKAAQAARPGFLSTIVREGAGEVPEEVGTQLAGNIAASATGSNKPVTEGLGAAAAGGLVLGAAAAVPVAALSGLDLLNKKPETPPAVAPGVAGQAAPAGEATGVDDATAGSPTLAEFAERIAAVRDALSAKSTRTAAEQQQLDALNQFKDDPAALADAMGVSLMKDAQAPAAPAEPVVPQQFGLAGLLPPPGPVVVAPGGVAVTPAQATEREQIGITPDIERVIAAQGMRDATVPVATETATQPEGASNEAQGEYAAAQGQNGAGAQGQAGLLNARGLRAALDSMTDEELDAELFGLSAPSTESVPARMTAIERDQRIAELVDKRDQLDEAGRAELLDHMAADRQQARVMGSGAPMEGVRKYEVLKRDTDAGKAPPVRAFVDGDNFHDWNKKVGHAGGDKIIQFMGETLASAFPGATFHKGGDEFVVAGQSEAELAAGLERARAIIDAQEFVAIDADGNEQVHNGVGISFGIGKTTNAAEEQQYLAKQARAAAGLRTERADNAGAVGAQPGGTGLQAGAVRGQAEAEVALTPEQETARQDLALFKTATRSRGVVSIPIPAESNAAAVRQALKRAGVRGTMPAARGSITLRHNQVDVLDRWTRDQQENRNAGPAAEQPAAGQDRGTGGARDRGDGAGTGESGAAARTRPVRRTFNDKVFNPVVHDVLDFIALSGGLDRDAMESEGVDPENWGGRRNGNQRFFGRPLFRKGGGWKADDLREALQGAGFLDADPDGQIATISTRDALDMLDSAMRGRRFMLGAGQDADLQDAIDRQNERDQEEEEQFLAALPDDMRALFEEDREALYEAMRWRYVDTDSLPFEERESLEIDSEEAARTIREWADALRDAGVDADTAERLILDLSFARDAEDRATVFSEIAAAIRGDDNRGSEEASPAAAGGEGEGNRAPVVQPEAGPEPKAEVETDSGAGREGEEVTPERLQEVGLLREFGGRWQWAMRPFANWMTSNTKDGAVEQARGRFERLPEAERLTRAQRDALADAEYEAESARRYGNLSTDELRAKLDEIERDIARSQRAGSREFNGNGGRRTGAATSAEAARALGEEKMRIERLLRDRQPAPRSLRDQLNGLSGSDLDDILGDDPAAGSEAQQPAETQDGDLFAPNGDPFPSKFRAEVEARKVPGSTVVAVAGGFVVRPERAAQLPRYTGDAAIDTPAMMDYVEATEGRTAAIKRARRIIEGGGVARGPALEWLRGKSPAIAAKYDAPAQAPAPRDENGPRGPRPVTPQVPSRRPSTQMPQPAPPPADGLNLSAQGRSTLDQLQNLFGPPGGIREDAPAYVGYDPQGVDPDTYRKAKPLFDALLLDAEANGQSAPDFIRALVAKFGDNPIAKAMIRAYVRDPNKGQDNAPGGNTDLAGDRTNTGNGDGAVGPPVSNGGRGPRQGTRGGGRGSSGGRSGKAGVRGGRPAAAGESGDQPVDSGERPPGSAGGASGADVDPRGGGFGDSGVPVEPTGATAAPTGAQERVPEGVKREQQRAASALPVKRGDLQNVRDTLPYLLPGQQEDVHKAETRFAKPDGYGMLFTNGTGTGKTFTGLGIVKRFAMEGRDNIIIVAPNDKIIEDWQRSGEALGLTITRLEDTKSAGTGIVITTYAGFGQNDALVNRNWDLVVADEAHYLSQEKTGKDTLALDALRAISLNPRGVGRRHEMLHGDIIRKRDSVAASAKAARMSDDERDWADAPALQAESDRLTDVLREKRKEVEADIMARQGAARTRLVALSATPFAYEKSVDWAEGYLFNYGEDPRQRSGGGRYNTPSGEGEFMIRHFGYRMRYGKLTEPDAKVDRGLMQRQFNAWLKREGSLSGRALDVPFDYDRRFQLVESAIGRRVDDALAWLREKAYGTISGTPFNETFYALYEAINGRFDHLQRRYLLEALKARESVQLIREHLALGRKVVVFHDFKKGLEGGNPFFMFSGNAEITAAIQEFEAQFGDMIAAMDGLQSPIEVLSKEFPGLLKFNGDVSPKDRRANVAKFNSDDSGPRVILVQAAAGKEGISLHDTTGKHQRALINLGLPTQPTTAIQQEGRIFRTGQMSNAIIRYLNTGTNWEMWAFATTIAQRASAAENLAAGETARALKDAFINAFEESGDFRAGHEGEGTGGKERDRIANAALTEWDRAKAFYFGQQKKTSKNKSAEGEDYFATPEPVGLKMVQMLDLRPGEKGLEPSGGHGAIARWLPESTDRTAIEPSAELRSRMALVFDGKIVDSRFEDLNVVNKYDGIAMNPPFGTAGRMAIDHLAKAATHLSDGGRIVALIPTGPAADAKFDKWFYGRVDKGGNPVNEQDLIDARAEHERLRAIENELLDSGKTDAELEILLKPIAPLMTAAVRRLKLLESYKSAADGLYLVADIKLPGVTFERAGAKVMTRIVVIEKPLKGSDAPQQINRDYSGIEKIDELFDRLENLEIKPRAKPVDDEGRAAQRAEAGAGATGPVTIEDFEVMASAARGGALNHVLSARQMFEANDFAGAAEMIDRAKRGTADGPFLDASIGIVERLRAQAGNAAGAAAPAASQSGTKVSIAGQFKHTRTGADVFVAKINGRVPPPEYSRIAGIARESGGNWSNFNKGGAIPGFHFKTSLERDTFIAAVNGAAPPQGSVSEDQASYSKTIPVSNAGGNMVAQGGRRSSARAAAVPSGTLDLFAPSGTLGAATRKLATTLVAKNVLVSTGQFRTGIDRIESWLDAAHVAAPLRKSPQEKLIAIVADRDGRLLTVIQHSVGLRASSQVDLGTVFGAVAQVPNAHNVWLAHNHPSSEVSQSTADKQLTLQAIALMQGSGLNLHGMIVVAAGSKETSFVQTNPSETRGAYQMEYEVRGTVPTRNRSKSVDVVERVTRKSAPAGRPAVTDGASAKRIARDVGLVNGALLLDARHQYVGHVEMSADDMANLRTGKSGTGAAALASALTESNANSVILFADNIIDAEFGKLSNAATFLNAGGWRALDVIANGVSAAERGIDFGRGTFSSRSGQAAPGIKSMATDAVRKIADAFMTGYKGAANVRVVVVKNLDSFGVAPGTRGAYHAESETIYLASDYLGSRAEVLETIRHELIGHYGLDSLEQDGKDEILRMIAESEDTSGIRELWAKVNRLYGDRPKIERAEEVFAHAAQAERGTLGKAWDSILSTLAKWLRKAGLIRGMVTMPELRGMARRISEGLKAGARKHGEYQRAAMFHRAFHGSRTDLFGAAPSEQQQALAMARAKIDAKLRGDGRQFVQPSEGPGDLFGGPQQEQSEMFGPARDLLGNPLRPEPPDQGGFKFSRMPPNWDAEQQAAAQKTSTFAANAPISQRWQAIRQGIGERLKQRIFDQFRALSRLSPEAFMQAHLSRGTDGTIEAVFTEGPPRWHQGAFTVDAGQGGLQKVLADLNGEHDQFLLWIAGNRAERLLAEGREHLFTPTDIAALKRFNQGTMPDGRARALVYAQAHVALKRYMKAHLDIAGAAGLIDGNSRHLWEHDFYVPFYRVLEDDDTVSPGHAGGLLRQRAFQRLKGGQEPLGDLLANTLANWSHLLTASMKNSAAQKAMDAAVATGVATPLTSAQKGSVWIMRNGVQEHFQVHDPLALEAMQAISFTGFRNSLMDAMSAAKRVLTMGVTIAPSFRIRNAIRDSLSALATADVGYNPLANIVNGWAAMGKSDPTRAAMIAGGGSVRFGAFNDGDQAKHAKRMISMGIQNRQILDTSEKFKNALRWAWDQWQEIGDRVESINRAVIYQRAIADGKTHLEASFAARDLMNFTSMGSSTAIRALAQILPFFNARLQGLYRLGRGAKSDPRRFIAVAAVLGAASALLFLMNKDDEEYQALPDYVRDGYWPIKLAGKWFYIPKPFEVGALATIVERGTEMAAAGPDYQAKDFASTVGSLLLNQLAMNPVPQLFRPAGEAWANYDTFRKAPIDSPWEDGSDGNKFDATTSAGAVAVGQAVDVSPRKIEHLVRGYFGWLGTQALNASDWMLRDAMDLPSNPRRDLSVPSNMFVVGDFVKDARDVPSKYVQRFYDMQEQIDKVYADVKRARQIGDDAEVDRLQETPEMQVRSRYGSARTRLQAISRQIRAISADRELTAAEKNQQIRELQAQRNELTRQVDRDTRAGM